MTAPRILFMGTPEFAVPSLTGLLDAGYPVIGVVTGPDKPRGRGQKLLPTPVKEIALRHHLPLLQPESVKDPGFAEDVRALSPDIAVVVAFRILPRAVFAVPRLGSFNLHASLLPKFRGAAPIQWAIINGETETGVTTFLLEDRVDTGGILLQERTPIDPGEDAGAVHDRLALLGARLVVQTVVLMERGTLQTKAQDPAEATPAPKIFKDDCHIQWDRPAAHVHNLVRGLSPAPGAWSLHGGRVLKIYRTRLMPAHSSGTPGTITLDAEGVSINTADHRLLLLELQQEGRRRMSIDEFRRGYTFSEGDALT